MNRIEELTALLEQITPGPWKDENVVVHPDMGGKHHTVHHIHLPEQRYAIRLGDDKGGERNCEANARFIAAAPEAVRDLLEVAKAAQTMLDDGVSCEDFPERDFIVEREHAEALRKTLEAFK